MSLHESRCSRALSQVQTNQGQPSLLPWKRQRSIQLRCFSNTKTVKEKGYEKRKLQQTSKILKGKATKNGNLNAMKHGAYSEMTILPHEDPKEFEALLEAVKEDYDPQGPTQEDKVLSIAKILWRKRRIARVQQDEVAKAAKRRRSTEWYNNLQLNGKRVREDFDSLEKQFRIRSCRKRLPKKYAEFYANHCLRKSYDSDKDWAKAVVKYLDEYIEWFELLPGLLPKVKAELCEPSLFSGRARS